MSSRERRRQPAAVEFSSLRWAVAIAALIQEPHSCPLRVRVVDVSTSGCRVWAGFRLRLGGPARLTVAGFAPIRTTIMWVDGWEAALRFDAHLHPSVLRHLVGAHPPDPAGPEWRGQPPVSTSTAPSWP